ncbi:MAG: bifunctional hydroxymethylpyrimidine kinase/phosphomethylpyrimidine kinase [Nitrososphaeraceae archaeon]|jgi:hydroxymethylpyrimidine kinase/phosphomethylpyrimidine kinase
MFKRRYDDLRVDIKMRKNSCRSRHVALTIAGSDSSSAAGIQGDLRMFSALGVYACTVITAITAQNTREVRNVAPIEADLVSRQISCIISDIPPSAVKIGMIHNVSAIKAAANALSSIKCPIVLDPVMYATNRAALIENDAHHYLLSTFAPNLHVITPNIAEAENLSGERITRQKDFLKAAKRIQKSGARNVIITGGHGSSKISSDYLLQEDGNEVLISRSRIPIKELHGSGCNFSAALTAFIARGFSLRDSFELANESIHKIIQDAYHIGRGLPVTDPVFHVYNDASRFKVLQRIQEALDYIESIENLGRLIPETQSNIVYALEGAKRIDDVAGVKGRIVRIGNKAKPSMHAQFGSSYHTANAILAYHASNPKVRSAMNIKFDRRIKSICSSRFNTSSYQRNKEPKQIKSQDGRSIFWGVTEALRKKPGAEIIYHTGDIGKEAMTMIFGYEPFDVIKKLKLILGEYP